MSVAPKMGNNRWTEVWPDALALAGGLSLSWFAGWDTGDLLWSLWLSGLVLGFAMVWWTMGTTMWRDLQRGQGIEAVSSLIVGGIMLGIMSMLIGGYQAVQLVLLNMFLPLDEVPAKALDNALLDEVMRRYGLFLPLAFVAERQAFRLVPGVVPPPGEQWMHQAGKNQNLVKPFKQLALLQLVLILIGVAHYAGVDGYKVQAGVFFVYFFPWRLLKRKPDARDQ